MKIIVNFSIFYHKMVVSSLLVALRGMVSPLHLLRYDQWSMFVYFSFFYQQEHYVARFRYQMTSAIIRARAYSMTSFIQDYILFTALAEF